MVVLEESEWKLAERCFCPSGDSVPYEDGSSLGDGEGRRYSKQYSKRVCAWISCEGFDYVLEGR
ncbi:hypothetical protein [Methanopyrus sp.]